MMTNHRTIFLLVLAMLCVTNVKAQQCANAFKTIKVSDTKGEIIRSVTIEIVARLTNKEYGWLSSKVIKIPVSEAKAAIKRNLPMTFTEDLKCHNPLKQHFGKTEVKNIDERKLASTENLGFCTGETVMEPLVLKVSAPGYLTDYYAGNFLGGCRWTYEFTLTKKRRKSY